jgi:hypothetical protein
MEAEAQTGGQWGNFEEGYTFMISETERTNLGFSFLLLCAVNTNRMTGTATDAM